MTGRTQATVLVVDDDPQVVDLYAELLADEYAVWTATDGEAALSQLDGVDVVLLDRRMPMLSGDGVLDAIRDGGHDCRVAMVTAVQPDLDVLELGFDEYLVKPVTSAALHDAVERLLERLTYEREIQQLLALATKQALLEAELGTDELADHEGYAALKAEVEALRSQVDDELVDRSIGEYEALFRDIDRER